jgi:ribosome-associated protein
LFFAQFTVPLKQTLKVRSISEMQINPNLFGISLDLLYLCAQILDNLLMIQLVETIKEAIQDKKGSNIVVADLTKIEGTICQYFIICTGNSPTQVEAIAESIGDVVRERLGEKPAHVVGLEQAMWVAMDYTDVLVHVFLPDVREYYDLEHLWEDAPLTRIPDLD